MDFTIRTARLTLQPFEMKWLEEYCREFNEEITRYQYPDPFETPQAAREVLAGFLEQMERGEMLFLSVLGPDGAFLGGVEVHGLRERFPELGVWIRESGQGKGYAYEALAEVMHAVGERYHKDWYVYEADVRNTPSIRLAGKFECRREGVETFETERGKTLSLRRFLIKVRKSED